MQAVILGHVSNNKHSAPHAFGEQTLNPNKPAGGLGSLPQPIKQNTSRKAQPATGRKITSCQGFSMIIYAVIQSFQKCISEKASM